MLILTIVVDDKAVAVELKSQKIAKDIRDQINKQDGFEAKIQLIKEID